MGNDQSVRHEPPSRVTDSPIAMTKPIKSAMTRSTSIRSHSLVGGSAAGPEESERKIRYLPSGLDKAHHGSLRMPTRPDSHGSSVGAPGAGAGGIESPQWGWYINTTPPTPEMFHSRSSLNKHSGGSDQSSTTSTTSGTSSSYDASNPATRGPNRVFQGLKAGSNRPPVGWPSVPL